MFRTLDRGKEKSKPPLHFERKEIATKSSIDQKSESKNNTTMETTPEINKIGFESKLGVDKLKNEKSNEDGDEESKFNDNLKAFNKYFEPVEGVRKLNERLAMTPGTNKRKLN